MDKLAGHPITINQKSNRKTDYITFSVILFICLIILVIIGLHYKELYQEDSYAHYLLAKYAWKHYRLFIDIWARPIPTIILSLTAPFGIIPVKILTIIISLLCGFLTYKTAKTIKLKYAEFVFPFLIFQPYFLLLSVNPLTEIFFATMLVVSLLLFLRKNYLASTIICSLLPLVRPEGFFFLFLWLIILIIIKKWRLLPYLGLGTIIWYILGLIQSSDTLWFYYNFPWLGKQGFYGSGGILNYVNLFPKITGSLLPFFLIGFIYLIIRKQFFLIVIFIYFFVLHILLWKYGLFKSSGYARYFVCMTPIIAIVGLYGYNFLASLFKIKKSLIILSVFSIVFALLSISSIYKIQPSKLNSDHLIINDAYRYYKNLNSDAPVSCAYPYFFYIAGFDRFDFNHYPYPSLDSIEKHDSSIIIWDSNYMAKQYNISFDTLSKLNYKKLAAFKSEDAYYNIVIFKSP
jgi:hypothetical protein